MKNDLVSNTLYTIRFDDEGREIKTLKINDKETLDYIIRKLEEQNIQYVIIKQVKDQSRHGLQWLLNCEIVG